MENYFIVQIIKPISGENPCIEARPIGSNDHESSWTFLANEILLGRTVAIFRIKLLNPIAWK